ncbi:MAG: hypothetical protein RL318_2673, partial [Fibrobacterota bacterium]
MGMTRTNRSLRLLSCLVVGLTAHSSGLELPGPTTPGPNPDFPPFVMERNGVFQIPWGAGNYTWPEQLFWENMPDLFNQHGQEMTAGGDGVEASGRAPIMSCVAWGYEYKAATGGDPANGIGDKSQ